MHSLAGMLPEQFLSFCSFAGIGETKKAYTHTSKFFVFLFLHKILLFSHSVLYTEVHECTKWHC